MKLHFFGAAQEVTGSNIMVETGKQQLLVDCGVFQGEHMVEKRNWEPFPYDASKIQAVLLTHAHLDHCGRLPKLYHAGFRGKIFSTPATRELAALSLYDSAELIFEEAEEQGIEPYFTKADVDNLLPLFQAVEYGEMVEVAPGIRCRFQEAGHILGSASIELWAENKKIVFSGDLGNHPVPILRTPAKIDAADAVVMESTYGHRVHEDRSIRRRILQEAVDFVHKTRGTLMIPAFAIQRTQEILYELNWLAERNMIPDIPFFIDSPLAIKATDVFAHYSRYYNEESRRLFQGGDDLFHFPGLVYTEHVEESKRINFIDPPKVIIAGSGMLTGGRIRHHLKRYVSDPRNCLLLVGYQVSGTLGRQLLEGAKNVRIFGETCPVHAKVEDVCAFSAHADQNQLLEWLSSIQGVKTVYLNHGDEEQITALAELVKKKLPVKVVIPGKISKNSNTANHTVD